MIQVSNDFKTAIYAPTRRTAAKVTFEILSSEAYIGDTKTVTGEAEISRSAQITNKKRLPSKYATYEPDYFKLDGSFTIPPRQDQGDFEVGWWSEVLCDSAGVFIPYQVIEILLAEESSSIGVTITFDPAANEYAADFDIAVYGADDQLIHDESIVGNTASIYLMERALEGYKKVVVTIKRWRTGYRRARIAEIDFGIVREYSGDNLINLNLLEEISPTNEILPAGEFKFIVDNSSREFNILNPEGFYRFLQQRQEAMLELGVEVATDIFEFVQIGRYYLVDWQSDEGALTTTFTARAAIGTFLEEEYLEAVLGSRSLYALAEEILLRTKVPYEIGEALQNIYSSGYMPKMTLREALQHVGIMSRAAIYCTREGAICIKRLGNTAVDSITFDNVYQEPQVKLDRLVTAIDILVNTYFEGSEEKEILNTTLPINGEETVYLEYGTPVYNVDAGVTVAGAESYSIIGKYNNGIRLTLTGASNVSVVITGKELLTTKTTYTLKNAQDKKEEGVTLKVDNPLINDAQTARGVAEWLLTQYNQRAVYETNWQQNPALECGDIVLVEDSYGANKPSLITKQEYDYQGYLFGKTTSRGGI